MLERLRRNQSLVIAALLVAGLAVWMWPALEGRSRETPPASQASSPGPAPRALTRVRVAVLESREIPREVVMNGRTEPNRAVTLRGEVNGRVLEIGADRGSRVEAGDLVVRLDGRDRAARVAEARALVRQRELQYEGAKRLKQSNFQSETQVAEALANLEAARAALELARTELDHTEIRAPFAGVLDRRPVEVGTFVNEGDEVARLLDVQPMVVTGHVAQQELAGLRTGLVGRARLLTGEQVQGRVRYIAAEADAATRTFRVELEVPNEDAALVSGITAETTLVVETTRAHRVSPSMLALDAGNRLGVKLVDADDTVRFAPVRVVRSDGEGVWVDGLPESPRVIVVGQGFVREGEKVVPAEAGEALPGAPGGATS